ncbi:homeobox protein ceh-19 [Plakobranchus ocellatus]|uniref:Homeobox protein ceh-19 n=1 Tax=Plakobranchus ocellatus TaxID=259542 RepID=A0AAV4BQJ6_9GAST|nr:homeobox protein ceh-19 [Plakobranchus ocellatus]
METPRLECLQSEITGGNNSVDQCHKSIVACIATKQVTIVCDGEDANNMTNSDIPRTEDATATTMPKTSSKLSAPQQKNSFLSIDDILVGSYQDRLKQKERMKEFSPPLQHTLSISQQEYSPCPETTSKSFPALRGERNTEAETEEGRSGPSLAGQVASIRDVQSTNSLCTGQTSLSRASSCTEDEQEDVLDNIPKSNDCAGLTGELDTDKCYFSPTKEQNQECPPSIGIPCLNVPQMTGGHQLWLSHAIWRHIWETRLATATNFNNRSFQTEDCLSQSLHSQWRSSAIVNGDNSYRSSKILNILSIADNPIKANTDHCSRETTDENVSQEMSQQNTNASTPASPLRPGQTQTPVTTSRRRRRQRQAYSSLQLSTLEAEFKVNRYLCSEKREALSQRLSLTENQVKAWFQNRRTKDKKQQASQESTARRQENDNDVSAKQGQGQLGSSIHEPAPQMTSALFLPQTSARLMWVPERHPLPQLASLAMARLPFQPRGLAPSLNMNNSNSFSQASNYLNFLRKAI